MTILEALTLARDEGKKVCPVSWLKCDVGCKRVVVWRNGWRVLNLTTGKVEPDGVLCCSADLLQDRWEVLDG